MNATISGVLNTILANSLGLQLTPFLLTEGPGVIVAGKAQANPVYLLLAMLRGRHGRD